MPLKHLSEYRDKDLAQKLIAAIRSESRKPARADGGLRHPYGFHFSARYPAIAAAFDSAYFRSGLPGLCDRHRRYRSGD